MDVEALVPGAAVTWVCRGELGPVWAACGAWAPADVALLVLDYVKPNARPELVADLALCGAIRAAETVRKRAPAVHAHVVDLRGWQGQPVSPAGFQWLAARAGMGGLGGFTSEWADVRLTGERRAHLTGGGSRILSATPAPSLAALQLCAGRDRRRCGVCARNGDRWDSWRHRALQNSRWARARFSWPAQDPAAPFDVLRCALAVGDLAAALTAALKVQPGGSFWYMRLILLKTAALSQRGVALWVVRRYG